jgi:hypothetical protein
MRSEKIGYFALGMGTLFFLQLLARMRAARAAEDSRVQIADGDNVVHLAQWKRLASQSSLVPSD